MSSQRIYSTAYRCTTFSRVEPPMADDVPLNERDADSPSADMLDDYDQMFSCKL